MDVFHPPKPVLLIMKMSRFLIHHLAFSGVPILARIPGFHRVVGWIRACQIRRFDFPKEDLTSLQESINRHTSGFLSPNHPEMMTDMMVDWAVGSRVSSKMAFWAARQFVNGPLRPFWIRHNLIANTKCTGPHNYSHESALRGDGVMLHPEGGVWWTSDRVQPLFPGVATLSLRVAKELSRSNTPCERDRPVYIAPVIWKYRFHHDVSGGLHCEMDYIEHRLKLSSTKGRTIGERFAAIQWNVLLRQESKYGLVCEQAGLSFFDHQERYLESLLQKLEKRYAITRLNHAPLPAHIEDWERPMMRQKMRIGHLQKETDRLKSKDPRAHRQAQQDINEAIRVLGFSMFLYNRPTLTQEHLAESLKRLRQDLLQGDRFDFLRKWMPLPVGPRCLHVRACAPIRVDHFLDNAESDGQERVQDLLRLVRSSMQMRLDALNEEYAEQMAKYSHINCLFDASSGMAPPFRHKICSNAMDES